MSTGSDDDRGGFEIDLNERRYSLQEVIEFAQNGFPQQTLAELFLVHAEDGKIIVACDFDAPTKPN
jgi:hypothetical protein